MKTLAPTKSRCEQQQSKCGIVDSRAVPLADGRLLLYVLKSFYHDGYTRFGICISSLSQTSEVLEKSCFDDITVCEKEAHNLFGTMCESCLEPCHLGEVLENFLGEVQN